MSGSERQRLFSALILLVIALFVAGGIMPGEPWRRRVRLAAIVGFAVAVAAALIEIALWWIAGGRLAFTE